MPSEGTKTLACTQCQKSNKKPSTINADLESLIQKVDGCKNNPEKSSTTKIGEHIPCVYSMSAIWTFDGTEKNKMYAEAKIPLKRFFSP